MEDANKQVVTKEKKKFKKRTILVLAFIVIAAIYQFISIRGAYLNYLELGQKYIDVFEQNLMYKYSVMTVNFVIIFIAIYISNKFIKRGLKVFFDEDKLAMPKLPNKSIALIMGAILSIITSTFLTEKTMLMLNTTWFGINDPIFNMDIGYFFFQKPFIELSLYYVLVLMVVLTVYIATYYIIAFNTYFDGINVQTLKKSIFFKQIITNIMIVAIVIAGLTYINTQNIMNEKFLNSEIGSDLAIYGAGLTDVTVKLWGYRILAVLIIGAVAFALRFFARSEKKKAVIALSTIPVYLITLFIVMTSFQLLFVNNNELDKEKKYIAYNIENTKKAYNINIEEKEIINSGTISIEDVSNNHSVIENIPIITKDVILKNLEEYQTSTGYYTYRNADLANYTIGEINKLVYVSPREMISDSKRTYNSKTYEYTHGYGLVVTDANKTDENGNIEYIQKSYDGTDYSLNITEPRIYFGTETNSSIIVNAKGKSEFDYPITSSTNSEYIYNGNAGLKLNSLDRFVLGITNGDFNIAFNNNITKDTKIITNRNIIQRAKTVMPYLTYDNEPYLVVRDNGSLVWVLDAYTTSNSYPYSQESIITKDDSKVQINYIRNSIKVLIDAYNGDMQFYLVDRSDPIAMAYRNIYPDLFMPLDEEIPSDIVKHMVYPKYLYNIQAQILTRYHNIQTEVLYRNDDTWDIAKVGNGKNSNQSLGNRMEAYYTMLKTVDSEVAEFGLVIPYTPEDKQNINAYLVGKYNGQNVLTLYKFKSDDNVLGIMPLENQIERDEVISKELETINTTGAKIQKNMMIVPINNTILYVEPIYQVLLNESQVPVLKKIIVASGNRVAIGNNLEEAIKNLLSQQAVEIEVQDTDTKDGLIQSIIKANNNLEESSNNNNWELMGKDINKLQELIKQLEAIVKQEKEAELVNNTMSENAIDANMINETNNIIAENKLSKISE